MEREEMEAAQGLQELGEGIVYTEVRGLPAPSRKRDIGPGLTVK